MTLNHQVYSINYITICKNVNIGRLTNSVNMLQYYEHCCNAGKMLRTLSLEGEVQNDVDNFIINIERFNEFAKQSKVAIPQNFDEIAKELKEANQPTNFKSLSNIKK